MKTIEKLKKIKEALLQYRENYEKYADGFERAVEKSLELGDRLKQAKITTSGYIEKVRELNAELVKKNEEIKRLKEDSTAYNLLNRLKQAVLDLINFK
jgi:ribosomal protein L16 Arg81 hydroxylase